MEDFKAMIDIMVYLMKIPFELWGFTLSFWDILIWGLVASILIYMIVRFFE